MKPRRKIAALFAPGVLLAGLSCAPAHAQDPLVTAPIVADAVANVAVPIIVAAVKPRPSGLAKFEGFVQHSNTAQITVRARGNDMSIRTFTLSEQAAAKMQETIDKGGYQWGDKVTVLYDPNSLKAVKVKGKPSRPL
jgi:hypothetical protein